MPLWRVLRALPLVLLIAASGCQKAAWTKVVVHRWIRHDRRARRVAPRRRGRAHATGLAGHDSEEPHSIPRDANARGSCRRHEHGCAGCCASAGKCVHAAWPTIAGTLRRLLLSIAADPGATRRSTSTDRAGSNRTIIAALSTRRHDDAVHG